MNHNMIRGTLYCTAFAAPFLAIITVWWSLGAAVTIAIIGAAAWIVAGLIERVEQ